MSATSANGVNDNWAIEYPCSDFAWHGRLNTYGQDISLQPSILDCIEKENAIPSIPRVVTEIVRITNDPDFSVATIVRTLASDPGVATALLRLVNSPLFAGPSQIPGIAEAVMRLGMNRVRSLVVTHALANAVGCEPVPHLDMAYYWRRSLLTGALASRLGREIPSAGRDAAMTAGLLCDLGVVILARAVPRKYGPIAELYAPHKSECFWAREQELLGITHAEVGALALEHWLIPEAIHEAVRYHHVERPLALGESKAELARLLDGAGQIAWLLCESADDGVIRRTCTAAMEQIGQSLDVLANVLPQIHADVAGLGAALGIDVLSSRVFEAITQKICKELQVVGA